MRVFSYCRVSTTEQSTENQIIAIRQKGYEVSDSRVISETVSGSVEAMKREKFKMLVNHQMENGDMLVVLKLDRLGRDNIDVQNTINLLTGKGVKAQEKFSVFLSKTTISAPSVQTNMSGITSG